MSQSLKDFCQKVTSLWRLHTVVQEERWQLNKWQISIILAWDHIPVLQTWRLNRNYSNSIWNNNGGNELLVLAGSAFCFLWCNEKERKCCDLLLHPAPLHTLIVPRRAPGYPCDLQQIALFTAHCTRTLIVNSTCRHLYLSMCVYVWDVCLHACWPQGSVWTALTHIHTRCTARLRFCFEVSVMSEWVGF